MTQAASVPSGAGAIAERLTWLPNLWQNDRNAVEHHASRTKSRSPEVESHVDMVLQEFSHNVQQGSSYSGEQHRSVLGYYLDNDFMQKSLSGYRMYSS